MEQDYIGQDQNSELMNVNMDVINELKRQGKNKEAKNLLDRWHSWRKLQKVQDAKEIRNHDVKIKRHYGICINSRCTRIALKDCPYCDECFTSMRRSKKNG